MSAGRSVDPGKGRRRRGVIVGLAGGIGSGKSFVASLLAERGAQIIDADRIVRRLMRRPAVRRRIRRVWGPSVFRGDGSVDPAALAAVVFRNPAELRKLQRILHPLVRREMRGAISRSRARLLVLDAPLLLEAGMAGWCDRIVFVEAPRALREARVRRQRGWSAGELRRREKHQLPLARKKAAADWVIRNAGSARQTRAEVARLLDRFE